MELAVSLADEAPLPTWIETRGLASVRAADAESSAADASVRGASALLYPSLSVSANERFTNATGFLGRYAIASASANLGWRFDLAILPQLRAAKAQATLTRFRVDRARQAAYDDIHAAWHQVKAALVKSRSARTERDTSMIAVAQARMRYEAGTGLFLEVTQGERDAFSAQISLIQADADLASARVLLRIRAGRDLGDELRTRPHARDAPEPANAPAISVNFDIATGINSNLDEMSVIPYPNPAVNMLNVPVGKGVTGKVTVEIFDLAGKLVISENKSIGEGPLKVNVASISNGSYVFNLIFTDGSQDTFKVSVNR